MITPNLTIYLVACCKEKREGLHPAQDLYCSPWFKMARLWVEQQIAKHSPSYNDDCEWGILSALHGLVHHQTPIFSYDTSLLDLERGAYLDWLFGVQARLEHYTDRFARFVILAGKEYRADLQHWLIHRGCTVDVPMQGLEIGEQLAWLKRETNAALQMGMEFGGAQ